MATGQELGLVAVLAEDVDDLVGQIERLLEDPSLRDRLAAAGRQYVLAERNWDRVCVRYDEVYRTALAVAQELRDRAREVIWLGTRRGLEAIVYQHLTA